MSDTSNTPEPGAYTDEETADGRTTHPSGDVPGQYEDTEHAAGDSTPRTGEQPGEYTDVDEEGDR
jgi:hypothetical protein